MLYVIEGPAGSGKTKRAYDLLLEGAGEHKDRNYILVIPEQSSISAQRDIVDMSPNKGLLNIDILSFNRLAHRIFSATGGEACDLIDDSGKNLIIRHIADDLKQELQVIGGELKKSGYIAEIRSVISEFMQYGIMPGDIPGIAGAVADRSPYLSRKLQDIAVIYRRFKEYMGSDFMTREELLVRASAMAHDADFLRGSTLIFDSFTGFTPVQYAFMEALLTCCEDIYVCITKESSKRGSLFSLGEATRDRLEGIASHGGALNAGSSGTMKVLRCEGDERHAPESGIARLGAHIFDTISMPETISDGSVGFYYAQDPYAEVRAVMRNIAGLVREQGYHYKDCGILMGDAALYSDIVREEAGVLEIPVYVDQTRHISLNPFTEFIRAMLLVLKEDHSYASVFHLLRSGLTDIDTDDIDRAENYILSTGIRGSRAYAKPFETAFKGADERERQAAERVRAVLQDMLLPIQAVLTGSKEAKISDIISAVRNVCEALNVREKLEKYTEQFESAADPERRMEYSQIYDILNSQFENMDSLIGDQTVTIDEFSELYEDALSEIRVGVIPPMSDVVMAGDLIRSRFSHVRALFFIGMTEGAVPSAGSRGGLISDSDRQILTVAGTEVAPTAAENAEREKFYFYMNLMKPTDRVCFSYPVISLDGTECRESYFMREARRCLNTDAGAWDRDDRIGICSKGELFTCFAENIADRPEQAALYLKTIEELGQSDDSIARITGSLIRESDAEERLTEDAGVLLFGQSFIESPTELEHFAACPYGHFLGYGLRLRERRGFEFEMRDIGTLLHRVLELFSRKLAENRLTFKTVSDIRAEEILKSALEDSLGDDSFRRTASLIASGARYAHAYERLKRYAARSIDTLRFQAVQGSFDNIYFERRFRSAGLTGTIDRSDEAVTDSGIYIDVIDYKTGNKSFDPDRIYHGLDIQLPVYMQAALEMRSAAEHGGKIHPAGLFYYHVDDPVIEGVRGSSDAELNAAVRKELRLRGVVNADMDAVQAFDKNVMASGKSIVVPVGYKKDGSPERSAMLYTEEEMYGMMRHAVDLSGELRQRIVGGDVSRHPYSLDGRTGCDYCAYKDICNGGKKRMLEKHTFPEAWTE
ncbi:MAG: PD-(D/E)XK nuclease family protein [Lachnospiraceae bacterium]|nr:PD-(D/E)XK nuclease family protein [Lachnospiraceae bacterium]